jgi:hypothetical protein
MSMYRTVQLKDLPAFLQRFPDAVERAIAKAMPRIKTMALGLTPIRDNLRSWREPKGGGLRQSLVVERIFEGIKLEWLAPYAKYAEHGAPPHKIVAKVGKALSFPGEKWRPYAGDRMPDMVAVKSVMHPGYPGWHFVSEIKRLAKDILLSELIAEFAAL